jgi:hypothetical protein
MAMDIFAFLMSTTGIILLGIIGVFLWFVLGKGTSSNAGKYKIIGQLLVLATVGIFLMVSVGGSGALDQTPDDDQPDIVTDYAVTAAIDSTTYAWDSADSSSTDENSGTSEITIDNDAHTIAVRNVCDWSAETASALSGCSTSGWDVFSVSFTITREDPSEWDEGARVTSTVWIRMEDITEWDIRSNASGNPDIPFVLSNTYGIPLIMITDGAGNANQLGGLKGVTGEFSPGESQSSAGIYFVVDETDVSLYWPQRTSGFSSKFFIEDDFGFSQEWSLDLSVTTQE